MTQSSRLAGIAIPAVCLAVLALSVATARPSAQADDRAAIIASVQKLFDAMAAHSTEQAMAVVVPDGQLVAVRDEPDAGLPRGRALREFAAGLSTQKSAMLERMWSPEVHVHGSIATLAAKYDFHLDGKFTHCGTDVFEMVKLRGRLEDRRRHLHSPAHRLRAEPTRRAEAVATSDQPSAVSCQLSALLTRRA